MGSSNCRAISCQRSPETRSAVPWQFSNRKYTFLAAVGSAPAAQPIAPAILHPGTSRFAPSSAPDARPCDYAAQSSRTRLPMEVFDRTFEHYVRVPFALSKTAIPYMRERGAGWIVNITSSQALPVERPFPEYLSVSGDAVYSAAKAAINRLTQGLAAELLSYNIAVNAVGPSTAILTPGAPDYIPGGYPTEDVAYLAETVLAMCHLPATARTGRIAHSMHFPWHHGLEVRSLDGRSILPRRAPPPSSNSRINPSGE